MRKKISLFVIITVIIAGQSCKHNTALVRPCVLPYAAAKQTPLFIYNLPSTKIGVEITVKQTQYFKGYYADYAKKFLAIDDSHIIRRNSKRYDIVNISVTTYTTPDSSQWYAFMHDNKSIPNFSLTTQNTLTGFNIISETEYLNEQPVEITPKKEILEHLAVDIGMQQVINEETQTVYRHIKRDTTIVKVPVQEIVKKKRSDEEMARQVAEFINKIKNQRYELVAGLYESFPEGASLEASIREMYEVENRYIKLFTGTKADTTYSYKFYYTPEANTIMPIVKTLCYFDNETGATLITPNQQYTNNNINEQIRLELDYINYQPLISKNIEAGGPVYRIPAHLNLTISQGEKALYKSSLNINQLGCLMQLPVEVLNKNTYQIEFDPQTGNLKSIKSADIYGDKSK